MKDVRRGLWLIAIGLWLLFSATYIRASDDDNVQPQKDWVWGCQIRGRAMNGDCVLRPFTKVGEADTPNGDENEGAFIFGFEPGNVVVDREGRPIWMHIPERLFVKKGETKLTAATRCTCR